jgi:hypothetical protein
MVILTILPINSVVVVFSRRGCEPPQRSLEPMPKEAALLAAFLDLAKDKKQK